MADDIETVAKRMIADANAQFAKYDQEQTKCGVKKPNSLRLWLSPFKESLVRTGKQQAQAVLQGAPGVSGGGSYTCNSGHMTNNARHVGVKLNGKAVANLKDLKKVSKELYDKAVEVYGDAFRKQGLRNSGKGANFQPEGGDEYHVELPNSRLPDNAKEVQECLRIYAEETRVKGRSRNVKFEKENDLAKKYLEAYDKAHPPPADTGAGG